MLYKFNVSQWLKKFSVIRLGFGTDAAMCLLKTIGAPAFSLIASHTTFERCQNESFHVFSHFS